MPNFQAVRLVFGSYDWLCYTGSEIEQGWQERLDGFNFQIFRQALLTFLGLRPYHIQDTSGEDRSLSEQTFSAETADRVQADLVLPGRTVALAGHTLDKRVCELMSPDMSCERLVSLSHM